MNANGMRNVAALALALVALMASGYDLSDAWSVQTQTENAFQVVTASADAYPESVGDPLFWLDANDTALWTIEADTQKVLKVPSKRGDWCLTTQATEGDWYQWTNGTRPLPPVLVATEADLLSGRALDLGALGSVRGMVFADATGKATALTELGTIFLVYGSQNGGGWLLGGGGSSGNANGYYWHRAYDEIHGTYDGKKQWQGFTYWSNPIFSPYNTGAAVRSVTVRQDGLATVPTVAPFNNGWQVLAFTPSDATCSVTGLGLGDIRDNNYHRSGGMKFAEIIIYDHNLTESETLLVEAYLQKKWFGRPVRGTAGRAAVGALSLYGNNTAATLDVPSGETLQLDELSGGHGTAASLAKTGAGTLRLANAERYGGTLKLQGGTLAWPGKAAPSKAELPHDLYLHFDASDLASIGYEEAAGHKYVNRWESQVTGLYYSKALRAVAPAADRRPELLEDALGPGLHALDFGTAGAAGAYLKFTASAWSGNYDEASDSALQVCTVVAVVGAQKGGGVQILAGNALNRRNGGASFYDTFTTREDTDAYKGAAYLDGVKVNPFGTTAHYVDNGYWYDFVYGGYQTPTWHVVARQVYGQGAMYLGAKDAANAGGGRYAEILIWNRTLSEPEVLAAEAYLSDKWLKKGIVGYATTSEKSVPDVKCVSVEQASEIAVGGADHVRIGALGVSAALTKSGTGTLTVETATSDVLKGSLTLQGGALHVAGEMDVSSTCELAAHPAFHYDPSDTNATVFKSGTTEIDWFLDKTGRNGAYKPYKAASNLSINQPNGPLWDNVNTCNGLPVMDFGGFYKDYRWLTFCKPIESAKHLYAIANLNGGAFLFGSDGHSSAESGTTYYDYHRGGTEAGTRIALSPKEWPTGTICWNGVGKDGNWVPPDEIGLVEFHPNNGKGTHVSALCHDRNIDWRSGGAIVGEVVVYDRALSAREKIATRNYLMRKWMNASESALSDLPEATTSAPALPTVKVAGASTIQTDVATTALRLTGTGTLTKTGASTLEIEDVAGFTGTVAVATGTVKLPHASQAVTGFVADGRILHVDATQGLVTQTNGSVTVLRMNSLVGDGVYAEAHSKEGKEKPSLVGPGNTKLPNLAADRTVVSMQGGATWEHYFLFMKNGETNELTGIRSVYWVIGSQRGGGFLLGGGRVGNAPHQYAWHRGNSAGTGSGSGDGAIEVLVGGAALECVRNANWKLNGVPVEGYGTGAAHLSGTWDIVSARISDGYATAPTADGFAFDGRILDGGTNFLGRCGRQDLAEVIIYNRRLTDAEDAANQAYLAAKWGFAQANAASSVAIDLAAGATLDCGGVVQTIKSIAGAGTVVNGTVALDTLLADAAAAGTPIVNGTVNIAAGQKVTLANLGAKPASQDIAILTADTIAGLADHAKSAVFTGLPDGYHAKLKATASGELYVALRKKAGFLVIIK